MFDYLRRLGRAIKVPPKSEEDTQKPTKENRNVPKSIEECEQFAKDVFGKSPDIVVNVFETRKGKAMVSYVDGLSNSNLIDRDIIRRLKSDLFEGDVRATIDVTQIKEIYDIEQYPEEILTGDTAIFFEGSDEIIIVDLKQHEKRSIQIPDSEQVIRGPKEGFTETFRTNTALLRRKLRTENLVIENMTIGKQSRTKVAVAYLKGIVNQDVLSEVKKRLKKIDIDAVLESGYIEQFIEDNPFSPIATVGMTQKPDIAAAMILEGRVAIICDGTPHVLTVPQLFVENIHVSEDYYNRYLITSFLRILRTIALVVSIVLPGFFVAMVTFNQEMLPASFLVTIATERSKTPFPSGAEVLLLMLMFELLKESGTRLPQAVGSAISIVGALIIGDAAVNAGIVGAPTVIIIAMTAVASFIVSSLTEFMTMYRYVFLFLGAAMGLIGIAAGLVVLLTQIAGTKSFGVPILDSFNQNELKDSFIKFPIRFLFARPAAVVGNNARRMRDKYNKDE